jgi:hypothetical protein
MPPSGEIAVFEFVVLFETLGGSSLASPVFVKFWSVC